MRGIARGAGFLACLVGVIGLAFFAPGLGDAESVVGARVVGQGAIMVIFLITGLQMETRRLAVYLAEWRLHVLVQLWIFVILPLLSEVVVLAGGRVLPDGVSLGFLFLGILPTTISTAVVFTMRAGGNVPGAVFNSVLSNVLAVFVVPVWVSWQLGAWADEGFRLGVILLEVAILVLLPLVVGQILRLRWAVWVDGHGLFLSRVANALILLLVFRAFADSAGSGIWESLSAGGYVLLASATMVLLGVASWTIWRVSEGFGLSPASRLAALFCGSQKSLASGVALAGAVFPHLPGISAAAVLLPVLFYHAAQLVVGAVLAQVLCVSEVAKVPKSC